MLTNKEIYSKTGLVAEELNLVSINFGLNILTAPAGDAVIDLSVCSK